MVTQDIVLVGLLKFQIQALKRLLTPSIVLSFNISLVIMSPFYRGGDILVHLWPFSLSVCLWVSYSFSPAISVVQAVKHATLRQCWSNVGLPSTTPTQHYPSIELTWRGLCMVSHWMWATVTDGGPSANINPALVQSIVLVLSIKHKPVFDAGPTLKQHWVNDPWLLGY